MSETWGEKVNRIGVTLRCHKCKTFAYADAYEGDYDDKGYTCLRCIRLANTELMEEVKRRFFEEQAFLHQR